MFDPNTLVWFRFWLVRICPNQWTPLTRIWLMRFNMSWKAKMISYKFRVEVISKLWVHKSIIVYFQFILKKILSFGANFVFFSLGRWLLGLNSLALFNQISSFMIELFSIYKIDNKAYKFYEELILIWLVCCIRIPLWDFYKF